MKVDLSPNHVDPAHARHTMGLMVLLAFLQKVLTATQQLAGGPKEGHSGPGGSEEWPSRSFKETVTAYRCLSRRPILFLSLILMGRFHFIRNDDDESRRRDRNEPVRWREESFTDAIT